MQESRGVGAPPKRSGREHMGSREFRTFSRGTGLVLATAMVLTACSSGTSSQPAAPAPAPAAPQPAAPAVEGQDFTITVGFGHSPGMITYATMMDDWFVPELEKRVAERTPHTLTVREAYGGSVATHAEVMTATRDGLLDIGVVTYPFEAANLYLHNLTFFVPFGSPDVATTLSAARSAFEQNPEMIDVLERDWNQRLIGLMAIDDYNLITTFPVNSLADLRGRRIAAAGPNLPWLEPVGATPIQGALTEAYTGLQTGVYDGWIMMAASTVGANLHEVAKYWTEVNFGAALTGGVHINLDTLNRFPADVQEIILELGAEFEALTPERVAADTARALQTMRDAGVTFSTLPAADRQAWADALPNIPNLRATEANELGLPGTQVLQTYLASLSRAGYAPPRSWSID